jgi:hypothetical protein
MMLRKILASLVIVVSYGFLYFQASLLCGLSVIMLVYLISFSPFNSALQTIFMILHELSLIAQILMSTLFFYSSPSFTMTALDYGLSAIMIGMIPIGFGLIHLISTHFQMIIKLLKKKK